MQAFFIYHSRSQTPKEQTPDQMKDIMNALAGSKDVSKHR